MAELLYRAHAKINLYLQVTGKRKNGYHDLVTVMQSISLFDTLTFSRTAKEGIRLDADGTLPVDDSNLVCKAARAYFARSGAPFGVNVTLQKNIPMQAGMGGGSADAAATLRALNELDNGRFTDEELCEIAAGIGADVPFCVMGGTRLCRGIGEVMTPVENRLKAHLVVAIGKEGVSTPTAFAALDERYRDFDQKPDTEGICALSAAMMAGDMTAAAPHFYNMFEEVILPVRPAVGEIKKTLYDHGALAAMMSGSGPSVWGMFSDREQAEQAQKTLLFAGYRAYTCEMLK